MQECLRGSVQKCLCQPERKESEQFWDFCSEEQLKNMIYNIYVCESTYPSNNSWWGFVCVQKNTRCTINSTHSRALVHPSILERIWNLCLGSVRCLFKSLELLSHRFRSIGKIALNSKATIIHEIECIFLSCNGIYQGFLSRPLDMNRINSLLHQL